MGVACGAGDCAALLHAADEALAAAKAEARDRIADALAGLDRLDVGSDVTNIGCRSIKG